MRTLMAITSEAGFTGCAGWPGWGHFWHSRLRLEGAVEIKVLKDLGLLFRPRIYRHSGPYGPVAIGSCAAKSSHPVHPDNPGHPASDARDIQGFSDLVPIFLSAIVSCAARDSHPVHPVHPGHPASDTETQQEVCRKGP